MYWFWEFGAYVGGVIAAALSPLWQAWDWLTGRRTVHLAWVLLTVASSWAMVRDVSERDYLGIGFGAVTAVIVGALLLAVTFTPPADQNSEVVSAEGFVCRSTLAAMAGITGMLWAVALAAGVSLAVFTGKALSPDHFITALFILTELAGSVDHAGGGKSCLRRAAERIGEVVDSLTPTPAGVRS